MSAIDSRRAVLPATLLIRPLKKAVKKAARHFGYEIVPTAWMPSAVFAEHTRKLFLRLGIDCVLDVGANRGQYRDFLREFVEYTGLIVSFEPIADNARHLKESASHDALWRIEDCALGKDEVVLPLNVMKMDTFSSFLTPDHSTISQFSDENVVHAVQPVRVHRLDSVLPRLREQYGFEHVYLKMDTQGYDLQIIEGAGTELRTVRALQTELALKKLYRDMPSYEQVLDALVVKGFDVANFSVVSADTWHRAIECDLIMVNRSLLTPVTTSE